MSEKRLIDEQEAKMKQERRELDKVRREFETQQLKIAQYEEEQKRLKRKLEKPEEQERF